MSSIRDQIDAKRRELEHEPERTILLPFPQLADVMTIQYRPMGFREMCRIEQRHEKVKDDAEQALLVAADKLIAACERIVRPTGVLDEYADTGYKWGAKLAREEFGLNLPEGTTSRQAVLAIFADKSVFGDDGEELLVRHAGDYEEQRAPQASKISGALEGESEASSAAI